MHRRVSIKGVAVCGPPHVSHDKLEAGLLKTLLYSITLAATFACPNTMHQSTHPYTLPYAGPGY